METLYRKYRPLDFDSVVGQDNIVHTLKNQIMSGKVSHAYLFSGTKGTGKTTVAKIFARAVNCPNEIGGNPCNTCEVCKASIEGADYNILELDAASNGNVDNIRQITESMQYRPINDEKYKVYIIDEAHALTGYSKEAFLKSLEEPPEYVIYILATTDPGKLPETILSRCQKYSFRRIGIDTIVEYLKNICVKESIEIDDEALYFIAEKSDGSMRESISKLDRCRSYTKEKITKEKVVDILGMVGDDEFSLLLQSINEGDVEKAFDIVGSAIDRGKDVTQFVNDFIWHIRNVLIAKNVSKPIESLNVTRTNFDKLKKESLNISKDTLIYYIEELSKTHGIMRYDENRRVMLETTIIRLANPETNYIDASVMARIKRLEDDKKNMTYVRIGDKADTNTLKPSDKADDGKSVTKKDKIEEIRLSKLAYDEINKVVENWTAIRSSLDMVVKSMLIESEIVPSETKEPGFVQVLLSEADYNLLQNMDRIKVTEKKLSESTKNIIKKDVTYKIIDRSKTKYADKIEFKLDDALDKIVGIEVEIEEDDK